MMLYADLEKMLPIFQKYYHGMIGATFEKDDRCVPGFLYIPNPEVMEMLIGGFPSRVDISNSDMETLARFKNKYHKLWIDFLPIIPPDYISDSNQAVYEKKAKVPELYTDALSRVSVYL